jgi:hypothetical protein
MKIKDVQLSILGTEPTRPSSLRRARWTVEHAAEVAKTILVGRDTCAWSACLATPCSPGHTRASNIFQGVSKH